jgi:hypothetical protein
VSYTAVKPDGTCKGASGTDAFGGGGLLHAATTAKAMSKTAARLITINETPPRRAG